MTLLFIFMAGTPPKVLLVGDSWADFMWNNRTMETIFNDHGHPEWVELGGSTTISGSKAVEWAQPANLQLITDALNANPSIEVVQLTMGGNDMLAGQPGGGWYVGISQQDLDALLLDLVGYYDTVLTHIFNINPNLEVLITLYDYPNFNEPGIAYFPQCGDYFVDLGQPDPIDINQALTTFQTTLENMANGYSNTFIYNHLGWMQFAFGYPSLAIMPGELTPPGDLNLRSPPEAMLNFVLSDCFHLNSDGYEVIGEHLWEAYYQYKFCVEEADLAQAIANWPSQNLPIIVDMINRPCS